MRVLAVRQPFAQLLVTGLKTAELRTWPTDYRGPVAIHASLRPLPLDPRFAARLPPGLPGNDVGAIVGVVDLVECRPMMLADEDAAWHPWQRETWAWIVADPRVLRWPIVARGRLGLTNLEPATARQVEEQLEA